LATASGTITPASLTLTGLSASNRTYNGTVIEPVVGTATLLPAVPADSNPANGAPYAGDVVTIVGTATGSFASKNVGSAKVITITGLALSGLDANDYSLNLPSLSDDVTPAALTISATSDSKVFDGTTSSTAIPTVGTLYGSDTVTGLSQAFASKNALGNGSSTLLVTGYRVNDGNSGADYTVTLATASGTITQSPPSFTPAVLAIAADGNYIMASSSTTMTSTTNMTIVTAASLTTTQQTGVSVTNNSGTLSGNLGGTTGTTASLSTGSLNVAHNYTVTLTSTSGPVFTGNAVDGLAQAFEGTVAQGNAGIANLGTPVEPTPVTTPSNATSDNAGDPSGNGDRRRLRRE